MIPDEYRPLVGKLIKMTNDKECNWEPTSSKEKFLLSIGDESITVFHFLTYPEDESTIGFEILDEYGERVDAIFTSQDDDDYDMMWDLYWSARRDAIKIKETISKIMHNLNSKKKD